MLKRKKAFSWFFRWAATLTVMLAVLAFCSVSAAEPPKRVSIVYCKDIAPFHFTDEKGHSCCPVHLYKPIRRNLFLKFVYLG